VEAGAKY